MSRMPPWPWPKTGSGKGQVPFGNRDVLALLDVADAAAIDGPLHRLAHLHLVAAQEALTVADGLVLASQPPVDDVLHGHVRPLPVNNPGQ